MKQKRKISIFLQYSADELGQPYAILYFPYFEDVSFSTTELNTFLTRVYQISLLMTIITFSFAFLLSGLSPVQLKH